MNVQPYFNDFLKNIRLTTNQTNCLISGHKLLRKRLKEDEDLSKIIVSTFLQGSYRRATAVRPKGESRSDVDVIVVTRLSMEEYSDPEKALQVFVPFMDKHYKDKYEIQGRSIGISLSDVDLDVVITATPSESAIGILESASVTDEHTLDELDTWSLRKSWGVMEERNETALFFTTNADNNEPEWKTEPLWIPDREAEEWKQTDPLAQIKWTQDKNKSCNRHYVNVVKAIKWWRRINDVPKYPKGYPVEHLIGLCCPDNIQSIGEGVTAVFEKIVQDYKEKPIMADHGVPDHDVMARVSEEEYAEFYKIVQYAATLARKATDANTIADSVKTWRELFGNKFPDVKSENKIEKNNLGSFSLRENPIPGMITGGRFG